MNAEVRTENEHSSPWTKRHHLTTITPVKNDRLEVLGSRIRVKCNERALLHRIASEPLPHVLTGDENLLAVSALFQAGHVDAVVRVAVDPLGGGPQVGVVISEITPSGWSLLRRSRS